MVPLEDCRPDYSVSRYNIELLYINMQNHGILMELDRSLNNELFNYTQVCMACAMQCISLGIV